MEEEIETCPRAGSGHGGRDREVRRVAAASFIAKVVTFARIGAALGTVVALTLFFAGLSDQPWSGWVYLRWLVLAAYPVASAIALARAAAWRKAGKILVDIGVESGLVAHVTEGLVEQTTRALADRTEWKPKLRQALDDYLREDHLEDETTGLAGRILRRLKRIIGRLQVRILLGHAELAGAVDGSEEAERTLIDRLEELFGQGVLFLPPPDLDRSARLAARLRRDTSRIGASPPRRTRSESLPRAHSSEARWAAIL